MTLDELGRGGGEKWISQSPAPPSLPSVWNTVRQSIKKKKFFLLQVLPMEWTMATRKQYCLLTTCTQWNGPWQLGSSTAC